jgi:hypothetical protein
MILRFNKIHEHIILNFTKPIKLEHVANIANISPTAFAGTLKNIRTSHSCRF